MAITDYHWTATEAYSNGACIRRGCSSEEITLNTGGTTRDSTRNLLPANSVILSVTGYVTTAITAAARRWSIGDSAQSQRFTTTTTTDAENNAGTAKVGLNHRDPTVASSNLGSVQVSAAPVRITTDAAVTAGKIRVVVFWEQYVAPTS